MEVRPPPVVPLPTLPSPIRELGFIRIGVFDGVLDKLMRLSIPRARSRAYMVSRFLFSERSNFSLVWFGRAVFGRPGPYITAPLPQHDYMFPRCRKTARFLVGMK